MMLYAPSQNAHWYTRTGEPRYDATLFTARREGLLPSVTTYMKILARPALTSWLQTQSVLAALTLPRLEGENDDDFAKRIVHDSESESRVAAEFGGRLHDAIAAVNRGEAVDDDYLRRWLDPWMAYRTGHKLQTVATEHTVTNCVDMAGRIDLIARSSESRWIFDFKTQGCRDGKPVFYRDWLLQLAAYDIMACGSNRLVSVVMNKNDGPPMFTQEWDSETIKNAGFGLVGIKWLWKFMNDYYPELHQVQQQLL